MVITEIKISVLEKFTLNLGNLFLLKKVYKWKTNCNNINKYNWFCFLLLYIQKICRNNFCETFLNIKVSHCDIGKEVNTVVK